MNEAPKSFECELTGRLAALREQGLYRELRRIDSPQSTRIQIDGSTLLNFSSNDYLGLANHRELKSAAAAAIDRYGAGAGASRLVCGSLQPHHELDEALAAFKSTQAALSFSSGYAAAMGTICALMTRDGVIITDEKTHACIIDAARLCGAKLRVFHHNDLDDLEKNLQWADQRPRSIGQLSPPLIVTESIFSMGGGCAPLREIVALKEKYGAWLMLDEAHATGLYGPNRRGVAEEFGIGGQIEIQMGTLGKALGASGGFICGSRALIDFLINRARTFIFSTAPVPAAAAAAAAGIRVVQSAEGESRRSLLWRRVAELQESLHLPSSIPRSAIIPLMIGGEAAAVEASAALRRRGLFTPAIRYPSVARGQARLRVTLTADHSPADVQELSAALRELKIANGKWQTES